MTLGEAAWLGALQGLTEFLPISSSGHLVLGHRLFGGPPHSLHGELFFDVMAHVGTALAVVVRYRRPIARYADQCFVGLRAVATGMPAGTAAAGLPGFRLAGLIVLALLPIPVGAILLGPLLQAFRFGLMPVAVCFLLTGTVLFLAERLRHGTRELLRTGWYVAVVIGLVQTLALLPGISRSGMTIAAGLALGLRAGWAVEFSMLLGVPAILAAVLYSSANLLHGPTAETPLAVLSPLPADGGFVAVAVGAVVAAVVGYLALTLLIRLAQQRRLRWFSYYLWPVGAVLIALSVTGAV